MTNKHEQHVRALQEMRRVMIENDNWENLKRFIEAVTAGGMAIQMLDEKAFTQPKIGHWIKTPNGFKCSKCLIVHSHTSIFCPSCGAKMVEQERSGEE